MAKTQKTASGSAVVTLQGDIIDLRVTKPVSGLTPAIIPLAGQTLP